MTATDREDELRGKVGLLVRIYDHVKGSEPDTRLLAEIIVDVIARGIGNAHIRKERMRAAREKGRHTTAQWEAILAHHNHRCAHCGAKDGLQKDHIVAVAAGGSDGADNLQPLCGPCNSRKWANPE